MTPEETQLKHAQEQQRIKNAYHRVFDTEDGREVLEHMRALFRPDQPAFLPQDGRAMDPLHAAIRDGQRQVFAHIDFYLAAPYVADSNATTPNPVEVIRP